MLLCYYYQDYPSLGDYQAGSHALVVSFPRLGSPAPKAWKPRSQGLGVKLPKRGSVRSVRLDFLLKMLAQGICQQIYEKNDNNQYQGRAVGDGKLCIQVCAAGGYDVQVIRQGHALVEDAAGKLGQEVSGAGEEDRRRLARRVPG